MELDQNYNPAVETIESISPTRLRHSAALWISRIFSPPILVVLSIGLAAAAIGTVSAWLWAGIFTLIAVLVPVLYIVWKVKQGLISDFHMRIREQRIKPMFFMLFMSILATGLLALFAAPFILVVLAFSSVIQVGFLTAVTLKWKISGHSTAAAGFSVLMVALFGAAALPALLLIPLVAWARVARSRHELTQTIAGTLAGVAYTLIVIAVVSTNGVTLTLI